MARRDYSDDEDFYEQDFEKKVFFLHGPALIPAAKTRMWIHCKIRVE
jgi:hypothetical protein